MRGFGQKIPLHDQLPNLGMQLVDVSCAYLFWGRTSACKCCRHVLYRRSFPGPDLRRMNAVFLGQLRQRHLLTDRFKRNLGFELWRMVLSFLHSGSLLSSCDPPYVLVRSSATTSQIVDATLVSAPRQRMTREEKARAKAGESAAEVWPDDPAKAAQKDTNARWTVKYSKARKTKDGEQDAGLVDIAVPHFGYKNHISIDRKWRFIRGETGTDAARYDGHELATVLDGANSSKAVWADTGYRSAKNEAWLKAQGYRSHIHRKKPRGKPMAKHIRRGNATRSSIRACVEHVFGHEKGPMALTIRSIGQTRAKARMTMANLSYNFRRLIFHERQPATA